MCSHAVAVATRAGILKQYLQRYVTVYQPNLTNLATSHVNQNAGSKASIRKRPRPKSPDVMRRSLPMQGTKSTLGEILAPTNFQVSPLGGLKDTNST